MTQQNSDATQTVREGAQDGARWIATEYENTVRERRRLAGLLDQDRTTWGLALSGGGIRSATFCLGLVRGLAKNRLLKHFDYLSTVSGGGYIGASLGRLFRPGVSAEEVERGVGSERSIWLWWLRTNGRYLTPSGLRDLGDAGVSIARGVVATQIELGILLILLSSVLVLPHVLIALSPAVAEWAASSSPPFSAWLVLLPLPFFFGARCLFAYWLTRPHPVPGGVPMMAVYAVALALTATCLFGLDELVTLLPPRFGATVDDLPGWLRVGLATLMLAASTAMILGIADVVSIRKAYRFDDAVNAAVTETSAQRQARIDAEYALRRLRLNYTKRLVWWTAAFFALIAIAMLDWVSWELAKIASETGGSKLIYGSAGLAALGLVICRALQPALQDWKAKHPGYQVNVERMLSILVFVFLVLIVVAWATFVHAMVLPEELWQYAGEGGDLLFRYRPLLVWLIVFSMSLSFVWLTRDSYDIVNMASLHSYYRARIERAYVSSGNAGGPQTRFEHDPLQSVDAGQSKIRPPNEVVEGDDIRLADYAPQTAGGPIHLINCCINQTVDDGTRYFNGDRKGVALTLSSMGTVEIDAYPPLQGSPTHPLPDLGYLSKWIAISGAAAGSGMGSQTSPAYSALLFLSGMRLGYWEPSLSSDHHGRRADAPHPESPGLIQRLPLKVSAIMSELLGQFPGLSHGAWYVSDGGHFENTGIYPLIKRELPLIVAADCGADPKYLFEDMESMIRKVRIDFGAEIDFIAPQNVAADSAPDLLKYLGTPESIGPEPSNACILLGRIRYRSGAIGTLLAVKPRRLEDMPFDVLAYADRHSKYPQQSTGDQFFDESQWESYQKLGFLMGQLMTPALIAQAQAVVRAGTIASSSLTGAEKARAKTSSRLERLRPVVTTAAGTGLGLSLALAVWQGFGDYREQNRAMLEKKAVLGKALVKDFAVGKISPRASQIISDLKQYDIEGEGGYADVVAALDDCERRDVLRCAELKLDLIKEEAEGDRDYWLTFHAVQPQSVLKAEERVAMLKQNAKVAAAKSVVSEAAVSEPASTVSALSHPALSTAAVSNPIQSADVQPKSIDIAVATGSSTPETVLKPETRPVISSKPQATEIAKSTKATDTASPSVQATSLAAEVCKGRRIFLHIYDEQSRPAANCIAQRIDAKLGERPVGVENVMATAMRRGSASPWVWRSAAVLYAQANEDTLAVCAHAISRLPAMPSGTTLKALAPRSRAGRNVVEIWLPPNTVVKDCAAKPSAKKRLDAHTR